MLLIEGLIVGIAALLIRRIWLARQIDAAALGWMSERWLAEHRGARSA